MAKICSQTLHISVSKLARDEEDAAVLSDAQLLTLLETLPGVVEELLQDHKLVVEVQLSSL